jgi:hypothetical protein
MIRLIASAVAPTRVERAYFMASSSISAVLLLHGCTYLYLITIVNIDGLLQSVARPQTFVILRHFGLDIISLAT